MAIRNGRVAPKIRNVMLAAPDVDVDVFRSQIQEMGNSHPNFTLFVARDDRALAVSRRVWGDVDRLGGIDASKARYANELVKYRINVVDLTDVEGAGAFKHAKFANSEVVQLIGRRLASGQTITDSKVGIGDHIANATVGAATTVGSAAGLVLSAPIAIVDPETRKSYGERVDNLGSVISDVAPRVPEKQR
jgi:esterase/lipase superfamily enzyme